MKVHGSFTYNDISINQYKYLHQLYLKELLVHNETLQEYSDEISLALLTALEKSQPNFKLYENQPYITSVVRNKLVDFVLRMAVRLKIVPYVFCKAVRLFDRYCSKRIVLLDQAQLVITTCLWIAAKIYGGNNHFANLSSSKCSLVKTILNLGFGSGARFCGPTERYRMPKISELVKLCGARCNYDSNMFKQMELHIMTTLDWNLSDSTIDDFLVSLNDLRSCTDYDPAGEFDAATVKTFIAYASCYLFELIKFTPLELAKASVDLVNDAFQIHPSDNAYFTLNSEMFEDSPDLCCSEKNRHIQDLLAQAVMNAPAYLLRCFDTPGPHHLYSTLNNLRSPAAYDSEVKTPTHINFPTPAALSDMSQGNYTYATPTKSPQASFTHQSTANIVGVPYMTKASNKGMKTPITEAANIQSHHYPLLKQSSQPAKLTQPSLSISTELYPQPRPVLQDSFYRNNNSLTSIASTNSSKGSDLFYESSRYGVCTPISIDEDHKPVTRKKRAT